MSDWDYLLPTSLEVGGISYSIRSDFRAVLDICAAIEDPELDNPEKALVALGILYEDFESIPPEHYQEAITQCFWFINCGEAENNTKAPKLMNWKQDFKLIVAPINRVTGTEIRSVEYMHWWTFIAAYYEIGDCLFAQVVRIRDMKARGKKLDKADREFYTRNRNIVDIKTTYTTAEQDLLKEWTGG